MAEIGIALLMLGATYALSEQENKEREGYAEAKPRRRKTSYAPKTETPQAEHTYAQPANQTTDKFFRQDCATTPGGASFVSLTGEATGQVETHPQQLHTVLWCTN